MPTPQQIAIAAIRDAHTLGAVLEAILIWNLRSNLYAIDTYEVRHQLLQHRDCIEQRLRELADHLSALESCSEN
jgi:hypothetical protein